MRRARTSQHVSRTGALFLAVPLGLVACAPSAEEGKECTNDMGCAAGAACVVGVCVARPTADRPEMLAADVMPPNHTSFITTEFAEMPFGDAPATFTLDRRMMLTALLIPDAADKMAITKETRLQVLISVPSNIPGRPERQFEATSAPDTDDAPFDVAIPMAERLVGKEALVRALPRSPLDRILPPFQLNVVIMPKVPDIKLGGPADAVFIEGKLERSEPGKPETEYIARAVRGGAVVSNLSQTDKSGQFKLRLPRLPARRDPLPGTSIELVPVDPSRPLPRLVVKTIDPARLNLGTLRLPPVPEPAMFSVPVVSSSETGKEERIPGAKVRFQTQVAGAYGADATFVREAQADGSGIATVVLLPGEVEKPRLYNVRVIPPEKSRYASRCVASYSVGAAVPGGSRVAGSIALPPKLSIAGRVLNAQDTPLRSVRVRAMRQGDLFVEACEADVASPPVEATTAGDGTYTLLVDPGEYRLEYEPPMGSASPLHFEEGIAVRAPLVRDVRLPAGTLIEARAVEADGTTPVVDAVVKLFEPGRNDGRAILRGQGVSGKEGRVRIIVPHRQ